MDMMDIKRKRMVQRARGKYIATGMTNNITVAMEMYQQNDVAEDERIDVYITSPESQQLRMALKNGRPKCDECDGELFMQPNAVDMQGKHYPTSWVCKSCGMIYYSEKTQGEWAKELNEAGQ